VIGTLRERARRAAASLDEFVFERTPRSTGNSGDASPDPEGVAVARRPDLILASSVGGAGGSAALAAAVGVAAATRGPRVEAVLLADLDPPERPRGPTMVASAAAWELEEALRGLAPAFAGAAARGHLCYLALTAEGAFDVLGELLEARPPAARVFAHLPETMWADAIDRDLGASAGLLQADLPSDRALVALAVRELHERGLRARVAGRPLGRVAARRALAGIDPGGAASRRAARLARGLIASTAH
jgi:hypothetical protein